MYTSLLGAFLLGMVPLHLLPSPAAGALQGLAIAPPAIVLELSDPLSASGILIMDGETGQSVFAQHKTTRRPMASLTKLMTALLIVENHELTEWVTVPQGIEKLGNNSLRLQPGDQFSVGDLLTALLLSSANDAAQTLAVYHSGSVDAFVQEMNARAKSLGLHDTLYANPSGLDDLDQWSTPQDMAWLTSYVLKKHEIRARMSERAAIIHNRNGQAFSLSHTHALLHQQNAVMAGKTGTTPLARECLVSVVTVGDQQYVVVLLRSLSRYQDMNVILRALAATEKPMVNSGSLLQNNSLSRRSF